MASKDATMVTHLCILTAVAKYLPDLWLRDAEMMSVALMSDAIGTKSVDTPQDGRPRRGKPRIGQCVLVIELLEQLRVVAQAKDLLMVRSLVVLCLL